MSLLTAGEILSVVPQRRPMRFIDDILEVDEEHILGTYTWQPEDCARYSSSGRVAPPFKLIEMAAQIGSVAWCIYHMALDSSIEEVRQLLGVLTQVERFEFKKDVYVGEKLACLGRFHREGYFRGNKIVSEVAVSVSGGVRHGEEILSGMVSGMWIPRGLAQGEEMRA